MVTSGTEADDERRGGPSTRALLALMLVGITLIHVPTLFHPFFIDDYVYLETVQDLDAAKLRDLLTTSTMGEEAAGVWWTPQGILPFYRPVGELTFAVDYAIWGLRPFGFHLTNLALHLVCTLLAWRLARRLFDRDGWGVVAALVFAVHPIHNEAVAWISGRFDLLVTVTGLASTLAYMNARRAGGVWVGWGALSLLGYAVGLGCKETAVVLPAVLLIVEVVHPVPPGERRSVGRLLFFGAGFAAIGGLYLLMRFAMFDGLGRLPPPYGVDWSNPVEGAGVALTNLLVYLIDWVLFIHAEAFYVTPFLRTQPLVLALCGVIVLAAVAVVTRLAWRTAPFRVGAAWMLVFAAPTLMVMPGERNVYLASFGMALIVAAGAYALADRWSGRRSAMVRFRRTSACLLVFWIALTQIEWAVMGVLAGAGEKVFRDIEAALPNPPRDSRIYVVNQCPLNTVGFDQALRLRYGRSDIRGCALSLSPTFRDTTHDRLAPTGPRSVRIEREGGPFFQSPVEVFHLFSQPVDVFPEGCERWDLTLLDPPSSIAGLTTLHFELPYELNDERLSLFVWGNAAVASFADYLALADRSVTSRLNFGHAAGVGRLGDAGVSAGRLDRVGSP